MRSLKHEGLHLLVQYPSFRRYWIGNIVSVFGDQVGWIALIWFAFRTSGSSTAVGIVTLLYMLPQALMAPIAGVLLDRFPKARMMAAANFVVGIVYLSIPLVSTYHGKHGMIFIYVLVALAGIVLPFDATGGSPLISELVPEDKWSHAYFLSQTQVQFATLVGPALGGILISLIDTEFLLYVDAITFFVVSAVLFSIPVQHTPTRVKPSITREFIEGFRFLRKSPPIIALAVISFFFYFLYGPYNVVLPVLAEERYGGASELGLLWTVFSAGALAGSLIFSSMSWKYRLSSTLAAIIALWGLVTFAMAFAHSFAWALVIMCIGGIEYAPWMALVVTARQRIVPREMRARIAGVSGAITGGGEPLGALAAGMLLHFTGVFWALIYAGTMTFSLGILAVVWSAFRQLDTPSE